MSHPFPFSLHLHSTEEVLYVREALVKRILELEEDKSEESYSRVQFLTKLLPGFNDYINPYIKDTKE